LRSRRGALKEPPCFLAGPKQFLDALPQCRITATSLVEIRGARSDWQSPGGTKDSHFAIHGVAHRKSHALPFNAKNQTKKAHGDFS